MLIRNVSSLYIGALATLWSVGAISIVSASASSIPPPAEVVGSSEATAPPMTSSEAPDGVGVQNGQVAEVTPSAPVPPAIDGRQFPIDGIRGATTVVGEVVGHPTGKVLMAARDLVTLRLDRSEDVKPHTLYAIARREQFVEHPDSGRNMGYVVRVVATVEMEEVFGRLWSGRIVSSTDYVTINDWVIPFEVVAEGSSGASPDLVGHVVAVRDELVLASAANVVYTDLGSEQGVKAGDKFSVIRPATTGQRGGPDRTVGVLRILAVQPSSSSAYLTRTTEPVMIGDRLEQAGTSSSIQ